MSQRDRELAVHAHSIECSIAEILELSHPNINAIWFQYTRLQNGALRICYTIFDTQGLRGYYMLFQTINALNLEECIAFLEKKINPGDSINYKE